jgi:hypothetical protein
MFKFICVRSRLRAEAIKGLVLFVCLIDCLLPNIGWTQRRSEANPAAEITLKAFLQSYLGKPESKEDEDDEYLVAWVDLNDDGKQEAIVYVYGRSWCGSGGCSTLVLTPQGTTYRVVTKMTVTRLPIRVMREKSHDWHDISVTVGGGRIPAHEARMTFDGEAYPSNPTVAPARPIEGVVQGRVIISPTDKKDRYVYR